MNKILYYVFMLMAILIYPVSAIDIYTAIDSGYVEQTVQLLEQNPELLNARNNQAMTPLNLAAYCGQVEIVGKLLEMGADASIGDNENSQPIHNAAVAGHNDVIEQLLAHDVDINVQDNNGMTALLFSIAYGRQETFEYLMNKGADMQMRNNNGLTPIHYAAVGGRTEIIKRLVERGADINAQTYAGETPLHYTVWRNRLEAAEQLLQAGADTEIKEDYGRTPLHHTARESGNVEMAGLLIRYGADVNAHDESGDTPLILAAWRGFKGIVNLLLDNNAEVPITGENGQEILSYASEKGLSRLFNIMAGKGADLSVNSIRGGSLLHAAAKGGSTEIISILIEKASSVNNQDIYGWTPLHYAAEKGRTDAAVLLISKGAEINARTISGNSPYNLADANNRTDVKKLLIAHGADTSPQQFPELTGPYMGQISPGDTPQLFAPDIVSTNRGQHSSVAFSPDDDEAMWSSYFMPSDSGYADGALMCSRVTDGKWGVPQFPEFTVALETDDDVPFYTTDGKKLYFLSARPLRPGQRGGKENIWIADKTDSGWGNIRPVPGVLNNRDLHWQFSVTNTGTIYFASGDPSGFGMSDIYKSEIVDGEYATPQNIGSVINTAVTESCPYIAPDGSYLLFASSGHQSENDEMNIYIFISYKNSEGDWSEPVNTNLEGLCPLISHDGKYLFYNGVHEDQQGIFWLKTDFLSKLKPAN